ncbi:glycine cleavage system protein GcvH [Oligoflexia bacterium]|nr:glycine cleavage system protein GcvH [Oligoflexia bacterium]
MMDFPADLRYTKEHEWVRFEDGVATIGITEFAQEELGEIVFVECPEVGAQFEKGGSLCVVESTKAASDVYAPIGGIVKEANAALEDTPDLVNSSSYIDGWMVKFENVDESQVNELMDAAQYRALVEQ